MPVMYLHAVGLDAGLWRLGAVDGPGPLLVDLPGHGAAPVRRPLSFAALANDLAGQLAERAQRPADVVGVSLGGMTALHLALLHPDAVRSLVIACAPAATAGDVLLERAERCRRTGMTELAEETLERWFLPAELADPAHPGVRYARGTLLAADAGVHADYWTMMAGHDVRDQLSSLTVPVTVIGGADDRSVSPGQARELAAGIACSRLELLPGPHLLPLSAPKAFRDAVGRHVRAVRGLGSGDDFGS